MISFNRSQRLGLNLDQHIALDAGAGTGKTTVMAERYVQHLLSAEQRATYVCLHQFDRNHLVQEKCWQQNVIELR